MPMSDLMAARLGRPDLGGFGGSVSTSLGMAANVQASGPSNGGLSVSSDVTTGRVGLLILTVIVGAMAISYITTRRIQF